jgi:predicted transcriptional regulator
MVLNNQRNILILLLVISILVMSLPSIQAQDDQENYVPPNAYSTEVLLNRVDIDYDLTILDKYAEDGQVNKIINEGLDPGLEIAGTRADNYDKLGYGTFYIYRSHFNDSLAVVINEVEQSQLKGLSIKLVFETEQIESSRKWEKIFIELNYSIEIDNSFIYYMRDLGYIEFGESTFMDEYIGMYLVKNEIHIFITVIKENGTGPEPIGQPKTNITIEAPIGAIDQNSEQDMKDMLNFLSIDHNEWEIANRTTPTFFDVILEPVQSIDPYTFDWSFAMETELNWLEEKAIISGLTISDTTQISDEVGPTLTGTHYRIVYEKGIWLPYYKTDYPIIRDWLGESASYLDSPWIPKDPPGELPKEKRRGITDNHFMLFMAMGIILAFIIGTVSYTRLKRRNILDNLNRKNIYDLVKSNPGIHFKKILRKLDFQPGALSYHLNVLETEEYVKSIQDGNYRRFYLFGVKSDFKIMLTSIQLRILSVVNERPGISQTKISRKIGKNRMIVNYHVKILNDAGIISLEKKGRESKCYLTDTAENYLPA